MQTDFQLCFERTLKKLTVFQNASESTLETVFKSSSYIGFCLINEGEVNLSGTGFLAQLRGVVETVNGRQSNSKCSCQSSNGTSKPGRFAFFKRNKKKSSKPSSCAACRPLNNNDKPPAESEIRPRMVIICLTQSVGNSNGRDEKLSAPPDWFQLKLSDARVKSTLLRLLKLRSTSMMSVVDAQTQRIVASVGRTTLNEDPTGAAFPWFSQTTDDLLGRPLLQIVDSTETKSDWADVEPGIKALLFGANWCPPCRNLVKQLRQIYEKLKNANRCFEIIYCSFDRSPVSFKQFLTGMPWKAFEFDESHSRALASHFDVQGIPSVLLLDEENNVITRHGRSAMLADPDGVRFPWYPEPVTELNEFTASRVRDEPSLILFTESSEEEDPQFAFNLLSPIAEREAFLRRNHTRRLQLQQLQQHTPTSPPHSCDQNGNTPSESEPPPDEKTTPSNHHSTTTAVRLAPLQYFYTDETYGDVMLEQLGLSPDDTPLPLVCIVDVVGGCFHVCEEPDVSAEVLRRFVADYRDGRLTVMAIPTATTIDGGMVLTEAASSNYTLQGVASPGVNVNGNGVV